MVTKDCEALLKREVASPQGVGSGVTCGMLVPWEPVWTCAPLFRAGDGVGWMGPQRSLAGPAPGGPSPRPSLHWAWGTLAVGSRPAGRTPREESPCSVGRRAGPRAPLSPAAFVSPPAHVWPPALECCVSCFRFLWPGAGHVAGSREGFVGEEGKMVFKTRVSSLWKYTRQHVRVTGQRRAMRRGRPSAMTTCRSPRHLSFRR